MKQLSAILSIIFLSLVPLACDKKYTLPPLPISYTPTFTPTVTPTATPVCAVYVPAGGVSMIPFGPTPTPVVSSTFRGALVIHNLTEWQAAYGTRPLPPVDFSTQMIVAFTAVKICGVGPDLDTACVDPGQVTVRIHPPNGMGLCNVATTVFEYVLLPQSSLPVVFLYY